MKKKSTRKTKRHIEKSKLPMYDERVLRTYSLCVMLVLESVYFFEIGIYLALFNFASFAVPISTRK